MMYSRVVSLVVLFVFLVAACSFSAFAQQNNSVNSVPTLVNFNGVLNNAAGKPLTSITGVTFSLYGEQQGGSPLWLETQNVEPDATGHYSVMLGSTNTQGLPSSLFATARARWLEVQPQGEEPQPRVMLLSVPYAMKAGDAQTLGGMPASAFVMAPKASVASGLGTNSGTAGSTAGASSVPSNSPTVSGGGKTNYVPLWLSSSKLGNSNLFQSKTGNIGIGTAAPAANLDVNGTVNAATAYNLGGKPFELGSYSKENALLGFAGNTTTTGQYDVAAGYQALQANTTGSEETALGAQSLYSNTTGSYNTGAGFQTLYANTTGYQNTATGYQSLVANNTGYGNAADGFRTLYANTTGAGNTADGYQSLIANTTGGENMASGSSALYSNTTGSQNTGVGAGALLFNVGGSTNTGVGYLAGPDVLSPNLINATAIGANAVVSESNALVLGGTGGSAVNVGIGTATPAYTLDVRGPGSFTGPVNFASGQTFPGTATLGANTFTAGQTVSSGDLVLSSGNVDLAAAGIINVSGSPFAFATSDGGGLHSVFFGFAGNPANTTTWDTGVGFGALANDTFQGNTAIGYKALNANPSSGYNTAVGMEAMAASVLGNANTGIGAFAFQTNKTGSSLTCVGGLCDVDTDGLSNATAIGANSVVSESNALILGCVYGQIGCPANVSVGIATTAPTNIFTIGKGAGIAIADGWTIYSSRRWKTNVHTLPDALSKVERLRGVSYDLKDSGKHEIGVIAEEVGAVVPEIVSWDKNGKDAQGVDYSRLTALLIEATKEQQATIRKQQEQIRKQRAQIAQLSSQVKAIQASLKTNGHTDSEVRTVKAQVSMVLQ